MEYYNRPHHQGFTFVILNEEFDKVKDELSAINKRAKRMCLKRSRINLLEKGEKHSRCEIPIADRSQVLWQEISSLIDVFKVT